MALALGDQLGEHDRHPAVLGGVPDVVLACGLVRGVQVEGPRRRVVGAGGAQLLHVGAVPGLGHREAPGQREAHDVGQVGVVVPPGAEQLDGAAEQAPLDAGLDHQREVAEGEHLDGGDRAAGVVLAAVLLREAEPDAAGAGQLRRQPGDPLPRLLHRLAVDRRVLGVAEVLAGVAADVGPAAVQDLLDPGRVDGCGDGAGHRSSFWGATTPESPAQARSVRWAASSLRGMGRSARSHQSAADRTRPTTPWPQGAAAAGSRPAWESATATAAAAWSPTRSERVLIGSPAAGRASVCWWTTNRYSSGSASRKAR